MSHVSMYKYRFIFCFFLVFHVDRLIHVANSIPTWCITKAKSIGKLCPNLAYVYGTMHTLSASGLCIVCSLDEKAMDICKCTFPMIYHRKRRHCSWSPFHPYDRPPPSYWIGSVIKHSSYVIVCCSGIHTSVTNRLTGNGSCCIILGAAGDIHGP